MPKDKDFDQEHLIDNYEHCKSLGISRDTAAQLARNGLASVVTMEIEEMERAEAFNEIKQKEVKE